MTTERIHRVEQAIKEEVAQILQRELKDPRIGFVTITRVQVTADLQHASIYFSLLEGHGSPSETETGLKSATGFVRRLLGERLRLRVTPEVVFRKDPSVADSIRISKILDDLKKPELS
ncbi:MAG: 30S ribosome-binding factor RbfA [Candidatus Omnitrophica bacterium]|nr:30S ribosome-binding factor RbfA [Candidatus Omnitrophota bacterium]